MDPIFHQIEKLSLTRSETSIANYVSDHINHIGLLTAHELAQAVNVSDTSVIRFVHRLGFSSYAKFRSEMNRRISQGPQSAKASADHSAAASERKRVDMLSGMIFSSLNTAFSQLDDDSFQKAIDILLNSRHKYIAGFHTTSGCAQYMATRLVKLVPHVIPLINADASSIEAILDIGPDDCLVVYTFLKHSRINAPLISLAKKSGAKVILVTDRPTNALIRKADITLLTQIKTVDVGYSYVAPLAVSEALLMAMIEQSDSDGEKRMHTLEQILERTDLF